MCIWPAMSHSIELRDLLFWGIDEANDATGRGRVASRRPCSSSVRSGEYAGRLAKAELASAVDPEGPGDTGGHRRCHLRVVHHGRGLGRGEGRQPCPVHGGRAFWRRNSKDHDRLVDFAYAEVQQGHVNATSLCVIIHCPEGKSNLFPSIAISSPRRPDASTGNPITVGPVITVRGTVDADVLKGRKLWIVTQVSGVSKFYPQGNAGAHWGPAMMDAAKQRWTSPAVFLGQASDLGRHFDVVVVLADDAACQVFWKYLADGPKSGFPGISELPAGAQEYDRVEVVRGQ